MKSVQKTKLKDEIRINIQDAILDGELKPGDRLIETRLAAEMGISQAPVREALKELEYIGLVESIPFKGTYVKQLTREDLQNTYDARLVLELYAVEHAAKTITEEQLSSLNGLIGKMNDAASRGDVRSFVEFDNDFHAGIIKAAHNKVIDRLWNLANISLLTHITTHLTQRSLENLANRHMDVYKSILAHDEAGAKKAIETHLLELRDEMIEQVTE
jgi:DNA-binding GntR family transcriptional regulator